MPELESLFLRATSSEAYVAGFRDRFLDLVSRVDTAAVAAVIAHLDSVQEAGGTVMVLGNGGSAAVAAHWVNDLGVNSLVDDAPGIRVLSLGDNASAITAVGNDIEFDDVFAAQLRSYLRPEDLVIALSVSGNSPNVIRAVDYANAIGSTTIGFTGMNGGKLKELASVSVHTESDIDEYGPIEDLFSMCMHMITGYVAMRRGRPLFH